MTVPAGARTNAPPLSLPGEHFIAATVFLVIGSVGLWHIAPQLSSGAYPASWVVGITHLFTLGWITTSIMGALYQFLPVALGQPITSQRLAHITFLLHVSGITLMVVGIGTHNATTVTLGLSLLGVAIGVFVGNLGVTLRRAKKRELTWWALCGAAVFLVVALVAGTALAMHRFTGLLGTTHDLILRVHLHSALYGWVLLVIVGVSHRLLPMFLLSHGGGDRFGWWGLGLIASGTLLLTVFHRVPYLGRELPLLVMGAGMISWILQTRVFFKHRHRPKIDPGLRLSAIAIAVFALVPLALLRFLFPGVSATFRTVYAGILIAGSALFVSAQYYKIVPFLIWNRYYGPLAGTRPLPKVADLYAATEAFIAISVLAAGGALVLAGVLTATANAVRAGAAVLTAGALIEARQLWEVSRRRP